MATLGVAGVPLLQRDNGGHTVATQTLVRESGNGLFCRSMAELGRHLTAPQVLCMDDDLLFEPWAVGAMADALTAARCGFVGSAVIGLSFEDDVRPHRQAVECWDGPVTPETIIPADAEWQRHALHNAANLLHVQRSLDATPGRPLLYKVARVGGCVLYDRAKLLAAGGFGFWRDLPAVHCGEDVAAQLVVMAQFGGAGLMLSDVYHHELPTTVPDRSCDAPLVLKA